MKTYEIENNDYELIKDYKNGFDYDAVKERYTENSKRRMVIHI